jgi:multiple sugar transport system substrate-binding protein
MRVERAVNLVLRICAIAVLLAGVLTGCSGALSTAEPATIRFAYPSYDRAYYEPLVQEFNAAHPQITVELVPLPGDSWRRLSSLLDEVDTFVASDAMLGDLLEDGRILSLDPFIAQDETFAAADFYPGVLENLSAEGKTWAVPAGLDPVVMYYNQDLFDQYGAPYPTVGWTWDDFLNIALAVRDPDAGIYGYAPVLGVFDVLPFIYQHGGQLALDLKNVASATFDDPLNVEALQWYVDLIHEHEAVPAPEQARRVFGGGNYSVMQGFVTNRLGMLALTFSQRGGQGWPTQWQMHWGMAPLPRDARSATIALVEGYFISAQAQRPEGCWQWIAYLSQQMPTRLVPPRRSLVESDAYRLLIGGEVIEVVRAAAGSDVLLLQPSDMPEQAQRAFGILQRALESAIAGSITPEEALSEAQRQVEALGQ